MRRVVQRAESPMRCVGADPCVRPDLGTHMGVPLRAESPAGNSVGRSPTSRSAPHDKPCRGAIKRMSPLQGFMDLLASDVGLRPTLLPVGLSALMAQHSSAATTTQQGILWGQSSLQ